MKKCADSDTEHEEQFDFTKVKVEAAPSQDISPNVLLVASQVGDALDDDVTQQVRTVLTLCCGTDHL